VARLTPIAALLAAVAIVTAGCASAGASGPGGADGAAKIVPSNAVAFVAASTDLTSSDWHGLGQFALDQLQQQTKLDWAKDVRPLVGAELDIAVLPAKQAVAFVQPDDATKLAAFAKQHDVVTRTFGDWTAVAKSASALDTVAAAKTHLADNTLYLDAMNRLPGNALVRVYANGDEAHALFASLPGQLESQALPTGVRFRAKPNTGKNRSFGFMGVQQFRWIAAALVGTGDGLELQAFAPHGALTAPSQPRVALQPIAPYTAGLPDEIPANVLAVADFQVPAGGFELMQALPAPIQKALGPAAADLSNQLDSIFGGETAIYVRAALPMPELTFVTQPADTAAAAKTLDDLVKGVPASSPLAGVQLHTAVIGGEFVASTTQQGIDDFRGGGPKLSADPTFVEAKKQSGMPDQTTGFVYANLKDALPLLALAGVKLPAGLPQLRTLTAFGAAAHDESTFTTFVGVGAS
jgi:hypothetical protein